MADSLRDRYFTLLDNIVEMTLQGKIASKTQVYRKIAQDVAPGTGEIFERCLTERLEATQAQLEVKLKAARILRALQTIQGEWERLDKEQLANTIVTQGVTKILATESQNRLSVLLQILDPNQKQVFSPEQLQSLAQRLQEEGENLPSEDAAEIQQLATGMIRGLQSFSILEGDLVSWIYERPDALGFGGMPTTQGPWAMWSKKIDRPIPQQVFTTLAYSQSLTTLAQQYSSIDLAGWTELALILQYLQRGLVVWFDKQPYEIQVGKKLAARTLLTFATIWNQLAEGWRNTRPQLANGCFQITLQILRSFAQREDFPLYGGIFVAFSGESLQYTLEYLDEPLGRWEATPEKARILTLLGYSQGVVGQYSRSQYFHEQALEIARNTQDTACEVANLNHLSRISLAQKAYDSASQYSQRALVLARQGGERLGEANALVNLGYSEVISAQSQEYVESEVYESAIRYLQQGLELSERLGDRQSQALCYNSLGIALVSLEQYSEALVHLEKGIQFANLAGDLYLLGLNYSYVAEAYHGLGISDKAVIAGCLGMSLLHSIAAKEWNKSAGLTMIIQGQMGEDAFLALLQQHRSTLVAIIGVEGYDFLPQLLIEYRRSD